MALLLVQKTENIEVNMPSRASGTWLYCSCCERAFQANTKSSCQYDFCDGHLGDVWGWDVVRKINRGYPKIPVHGKEYPLYGDGRFTNLRRAGYDEDAGMVPYNC